MNNGYIKIWRKIQESFIYTDSEALHLWVHLLLKANHKDKEFLFNGKKQICKRGQLLTGRNTLSKETRISPSKVYRLLKTFESEHLIEQQKTNLFTLISITCYERYQSNEHQNEHPVNIQRTSSEHPVNTNKNDKNVKNIYSVEQSSPPSRVNKKTPQGKTPTECKTKHGVRNLTAPIKYLNKVTGKKFRVDNESHLKLVKARYDDGAKPEDFKFVINNKYAEWGDDDRMEKYLRPKTLFNKTNWEAYINERPKNDSRGTIKRL